jgi:cytochrome c oxidase cbb3-type subunit III
MTKHEADAGSRSAASHSATTGHEWDGIAELNTPLPRWWLWTFYATIIWAIGYWIFFPAWPMISSFTSGALGYSSRSQVATDLADLQKVRGAKGAALTQVSLADIEKDPELLAFAQAQGKAAFANNCAPCHGVGATGAKGYPNLNDDDWLWGGSLEEIKETIEHGVRSGDAKDHESAMPAFGKNNTLKPADIVAVANYVRSLSGLSTRPGVDLAAGNKIFTDNCGTCHGPDGKGNRELGAPNLTDQIWLYGSSEGDVIETVTNSRSGVMPAWAGRLDPATINALTVYVHTLGGGK